jgi:uncharacterized membrane protein YbhN (UPF0104 family)
MTAAPPTQRASGAGRLRAHHLPSRWVLALGVAVLGGAALISAVALDRDTGHDLAALLRAVGRSLLNLRWPILAVVLALAALHYVATAIAARCAAGVPLPMGETTLVQLAAAAANRLTPAGLGGSAVTARFFTRRGLDAPAAIGAVSALQVLGGVADFAVLLLLLSIGAQFGLHGSSREIGSLTGHVTHLADGLRSVWTWLAIGAVLVAVVFLVRRLRWDWRHFGMPIAQLARHPVRLLTLLVASGSTTLILAFAFAACTAMVPGTAPQARLGALLVAFMLGAAVGSAVPVPAGLGSTEAALVTVLVAMHVPAGHAAEDVLIFRLITFWAPAALGVLATRVLRRRGAI